MRYISALIFLTLICGCKDNEKLQQLNEELNQQRFKIENISAQLTETKRESELTNSKLMSRIQELESENRILIEQLSGATNELATITERYEKVMAYIAQRKQAQLNARTEEQRRQGDALKKVKEANLPSDYPFRIFNAQYIGKWRQNDVSDNYAIFSVRNYTDKQLEGTATSVKSRIFVRGLGWTEDTLRIIIPPNSTKERLFIRANENGGLRIQSNLGIKEIMWEKK